MVVSQGGGGPPITVYPPSPPKPQPPQPQPQPPTTTTYTNQTQNTGSASATQQGYTTSGPPQPGDAGYNNYVAAQTSGGGGGGGGSTSGGTTQTIQLPAALTGSTFVDYVRSRCGSLNLDVLAVFANAINEGLSGGIGDTGTAYGPWQTHFTDGRLTQYSGDPPYSENVQYYAWSKDGIDYALEHMADSGAAGKSGHDAVSAIVYGYEKPADESGAASNRDDTYDYLRSLGDSAWQYLAQLAQGPSLTPIGSAAAVAITQPVTVDGPSGSYKTWVQYLASDWPGAGVYITNVATGLHREVFS